MLQKMSGRLKLTLALLFFLQLGVITWSYYGDIWKEESRLKLYKSYLENPMEVKSLDLSNLKLDKLIDEISQFQNLEYLNLSNNLFEEIPGIIFRLPKLKEVNLSGNRIKEVTFIENSTISRLDLSNNRLEYMDYDLCNVGCFERLDWLDLSNNNLEEFPYFGSSKVDTILLANNKLNNFYSIQLSMPSDHIVEYLDVSGNPIEGKSDQLYEVMGFDYGDLKTLSTKCYSLNISNITYEYFPYEILTYDRELEDLVESLKYEEDGRRLITTMDMDYNEPAKQHKLKALNISNSKFIDDEIHFQKSDLEILNLSNSNLDFSVSMFENFPKIQVLYLENIKLEDFDFKQKTITELNLKGLESTFLFKLGLSKLNLLKLETLNIDYDFAVELLDSNLPNLQTIRIYNMPEGGDELGEKLKNTFPILNNVTVIFFSKVKT